MPFFSAGQKLTATALQRVAPLAGYKQSDEIVNGSATFQDDDDLFVSLEANAVYKGQLHLLYNSGTTPDIKWQFTRPSGCTLADWSFLGFNTAGTFAYGFGGEAIAAGGLGSKVTADAWGLITTTSAGILQFQWAQNTSTGSNTIMMAGSYLYCQRLA
jgi:hypothetical protein